MANNNEECGYDGGDCCDCTCVSTAQTTCGEEGIGFDCRDPDASCVDKGTIESSFCVERFMGDGDCDFVNNDEECGYDGGDCCECTCVDSEEHTCGDLVEGGFACIDPNAPCADVHEFFFPAADDFEGSMTFSSCEDAFIGDGFCDIDNNNSECGYDGGDCCECDCVNGPNFACGSPAFDPASCIDPDSPCFSGYVEAGTKTTVGVSANAFDTRPGGDVGDIGCMTDGCLPALVRDGDSDDNESRWSCARTLLPEGGGECSISFTFEDPQDIKAIQVAFWRRTVRSRTLKVTVDGEDVGSIDSVAETIFADFGTAATDVRIVSLTAMGLEEHEWISLEEVRFLVEP